MAAKRVARPAVKAQLSTGSPVPDSDDATYGRHLGELADAVDRVEGNAIPTRAQVTVSLVVGINRINHGLGRIARGCTVTPTVANAAFAWAMTAADSKQVVLTVVGVAQPNAFVEVT